MADSRESAPGGFERLVASRQMAATNPCPLLCFAHSGMVTRTPQRSVMDLDEKVELLCRGEPFYDPGNP